MDSISNFMTHDHRACDEVFAIAEESVGKGNWAKAAGEFEKFRKEMERHLSMEEQVLFPAFDTKTGMDMGPTYVMRSEHQQMRKVMDDMAQAVAAKDGDDYLGQSETLLVLMQQHNMKEEQMLYRMMDQTFGAEADALLAQAKANS